jgi:PhoH-like ATPase
MAKGRSQGKIFVLDTSVILYESNSIMNFDEHDVAIPITVLEELDQFKKGNDIINYEAREFIRLLDNLAQGHTLQNWVPLNGRSKGKFKVVMNTTNGVDAVKIFDEEKADHRILNSALALQRENPNRKVILVSKDINLRLKAKSLNLPAEDYTTGKIQNVNSLFSGKSELNEVPP